MLQARSRFFKAQLDARPVLSKFRNENMGQQALAVFPGYIYTGRLEFVDAAAYSDLFGAGVAYGLRDPGEIDFLAFRSLAKALALENAADVRGRRRVLDLVDERFPS